MNLILEYYEPKPFPQAVFMTLLFLKTMQTILQAYLRPRTCAIASCESFDVNKCTHQWRAAGLNKETAAEAKRDAYIVKTTYSEQPVTEEDLVSRKRHPTQTTEARRGKRSDFMKNLCLQTSCSNALPVLFWFFCNLWEMKKNPIPELQSITAYQHSHLAKTGNHNTPPQPDTSSLLTMEHLGKIFLPISISDYL